ncbi:MAG: endonuclease/exonuclease/phosphatase family protein [Anaerolineae bacterium]|nr:endonuclease/exonuclease/phosphatase family protein [Anaerolineae bacterium]
MMSWLWIALLVLMWQPLEPVTLSLLTYNLHMEKIEVDPIIAVIREADADVVALQEMHYENISAFDTAFDLEYPYRTTVEYGDRNTQMLMSRYPVRGARRWPANETQMLRAEIDVNGTTIVIYNVHPTSPGNTGMDTSARSRELDVILEAAAEETAPLVLLGDFNMQEWSEDYARVTSQYVDAFRTLYSMDEDAGFTYPDYSTSQARKKARLPAFTPLVLRLDYIFHSADWQPIRVQVWPDSGGSDHRPVYAQLQLMPG